MTTGCTRWLPIGIATVLHFLVDGLCVCCLYLMAKGVDGSDLLMLFLTYNVLAFMTQPLTGLWIDRLRNKHAALLTAMGVLTAAVVVYMCAVMWWGLPLFSAMITAVLLGMGNSVFHVWGGKLTATLTANDMRGLGIFVSSGVMGLTIGILYASLWLMAGMLLLFTLLGAVASRLPATLSPLTSYHSSFSSHYTPHISHPSSLTTYFFLFAILLFVMLRSFVGEVVSVGVEKQSTVLLLLAATAMIGKASGGWIARWCGISNALVACVGITAACLMFRVADNVPLIPVVIGVLAINFTMPITLCLANRLLPLHEGLSFGLLAAVLIPGYLLAKSVQLSPDHYFMLSALLLTIAVEVGMLKLMGERQKKVLIGAVAVNILTNVPLNYFLLTFGNSMSRFVVGELLVLMVEMLWYFCFVHQWRKAAVYSIICNATSLLVGILIQIIVNYSL